MNNLLIEVTPGLTRTALFENGELMEYNIEEAESRSGFGSIFLGVVQNILPGMQAAFVDIGRAKNAFIYASDLVTEADAVFSEKNRRDADYKPSIKSLVHVGQKLIVQIQKEEVGTKGAKVTGRVSLPGRRLVLIPRVDYMAISSKIEAEEERSRLRSIMEELKPCGHGVIIRTAAVGCGADELMNEMNMLIDKWHSIEAACSTMTKPGLVFSEEPLAVRTVRDMKSDGLDRVILNTPAAMSALSEEIGRLPEEAAEKFGVWSGSGQLFDAFEVDTKLAKLTARRVWLKNGGFIVIDRTEALTAIDVNSGHYTGSYAMERTSLEVNLLAAEEIARQLRLRDIGGIIIVDFIDMHEEVDRNRVRECLIENMRNDCVKTAVCDFTELGLLELTRKRR